MSKVTRIRHELPVSMDIVHVVAEFDTALVKAIDAAKEAGLPHGAGWPVSRARAR
ncbi:hypothetical protein [Pseudomonas aeruginosa]|jgi:hypothetical protein|nr:hypothetical protein [Pseudomonas aeruginosa]MDU5645169.1 hypothetical protein [Pseudomonas aeruginosa]MDV7950163.1 hypothetical protein [Pseudomonas aeruginosa]MEE1875873.1 hypothetical protein [Pseudomonas aeruginosa]